MQGEMQLFAHTNAKEVESMKIKRQRKPKAVGRDRAKRVEDVMVTHSDVPDPHDG
jgi:hypothetical protein